MTRIVCFFILISISCFSQKRQKRNKKSTKLAYEVFANDPTGLRLYTLDNGLKVYLAQNDTKPKIETLIAVKAGSTYDPADQTGLAHYLEHMLFKGTSKLGTSDWGVEKAKLSTISNLYEKHKETTDPSKRKHLYKQIDSISNIASKYAIANEYDKLTSSIGAEGTNAFTSNEMTVYVNRIPSNEIDKWIAIEKERFSELVLRLFHTELEIVYEEFNKGQDNDGRKKYYALLETLFPTHPYGTQTTIGTAEHLKNPSMKAIHRYFDKYYVPNNMAIVMVGDLNFEETISKIKNTLGTFERKEVTASIFAEEKPIDKPIEKIVYGPSEGSIDIGFRTKGKTDKDYLMITLIDNILSNATAGLIDLNLNNLQKIQKGGSWTNFNKDYGMHVLTAHPRANQSLDEVKTLLLEQVELVKKGEFDDWLIGAIINDLKLSEINSFDKSKQTAYEYLSSFIYGIPWQERLNRLSEMKKITKEDVMKFANEFYKNNYVIIKKLVGEDPNQVKVENPEITPIVLNRDTKSEFTIAFDSIQSANLNVQTLDYKKAIENTLLDNNINIAFVENTSNDLSSLTLRFPTGTDDDSYLGLSFDYLDLIGTNYMSNESLTKEFFKIGVTKSYVVTEDEVQIRLSGLQENILEGCKLLFGTLIDLKYDEEAYVKLTETILTERQNTLKDKSSLLFDGLVNYSKYGENSRLRNQLTKSELENMHPILLVSKIVSLFMIKPEIFYYGKNSKPIKDFFETAVLFKNSENVAPSRDKYHTKETEAQVYFVDYDMVQAELVLLSRKNKFDKNRIAEALLYNTYFGSGLSSIVFQEIRESKSLAYSAMSKYSTAKKQSEFDYLVAYIGTQSNKLPEALKAIKELLNEMPLNEAQFKSAKESVLKTLAASRVTKSNIYWEYQRLKKLGINNDNRKEIYDQVEKITLKDLETFFNTEVKNTKFDLLVIGNKKDIDFSSFNNFGTVKEMAPNFLFNYDK